MISIKNALFPIIFILAFLYPFSASATEASPYLLLEHTAKSLFEKMAKLSSEQRKNKDVLRALVEQELMPIIDYQYTSFKILGPNLKKSSKPQRKRFVDLMRQDLLETYTAALSGYEAQEVIFEPPGTFKNQGFVIVRAKIVDTAAPPISLHFKLRQDKKTQQWKLFDLAVEGISLVQSKNVEFSAQIRSVGLDGLIRLLQAKYKLMTSD
ncbi:MAG: phospholipid transport system substrate-binding protein [Paraglaciecola sp.]|jgi:phospholipid transport system substrate-binding protein